MVYIIHDICLFSLFLVGRILMWIIVDELW